MSALCVYCPKSYLCYDYEQFDMRCLSVDYDTRLVELLLYGGMKYSYLTCCGGQNQYLLHNSNIGTASFTALCMLAIFITCLMARNQNGCLITSIS